MMSIAPVKFPKEFEFYILPYHTNHWENKGDGSLISTFESGRSFLINKIKVKGYLQTMDPLDI